MSTTPTTTKKISYIVYGGRREPLIPNDPPLFSLVLLNRAGRIYKSDIISELEKLHVFEIVSIESGGPGYNVEALSARFPLVKFIKMRKNVTEGEKINIGINETQAKYVLVMYDDMHTFFTGVSMRLIDQIEASGSLCTVPLIQSKKMSIVPSIINPAYQKKLLKIIQLPPSVDGVKSLFPFDYCGIYNKLLFTELGGFDERIKNNWWQKMDFGFRTYMWGESIQCKPAFMVKYLDELPEESNTIDANYRFFYLKNLAVHFNGEFGMIPKSSFFKFHLKSGENIFQTLKEFSMVSNWVKTNNKRFKMDARELVETWEAASI